MGGRQGDDGPELGVEGAVELAFESLMKLSEAFPRLEPSIQLYRLLIAVSDLHKPSAVLTNNTGGLSRSSRLSELASTYLRNKWMDVVKIIPVRLGCFFFFVFFSVPVCASVQNF
jgi:hypothetical protein